MVVAGLAIESVSADVGALMKAQLARIAATEGLSKNVYELASKALAD